MGKNVGPEDRVVRVVVALALGVLIYLGQLGDTAEIVTGIVAIYLLLSGLAARCLVYKMLGVDTGIQENPYTSTDDRAGF